MSLSLSGFVVPILEIIWIDVVLSGDNAIVIALACASLPLEQRSRGVIFGTAAAIGLRAVFTLVFVQLLTLPFVKLIGGLLLLWIAVKLARDERQRTPMSPASSVFAAVRVIVIADAVMSLDNIVAIAAAAKGSVLLVIFGLTLSIPLIIFGSTLLIGLFKRFPSLVWAGAALLGFIGGELIGREIVAAPAPIGDLAFVRWAYFTGICGLGAAIFVLLLGRLLPQSEEHAPEGSH
jgi:YjbE family integral membrane protein